MNRVKVIENFTVCHTHDVVLFEKITKYLFTERIHYFHEVEMFANGFRVISIYALNTEEK